MMYVSGVKPLGWHLQRYIKAQWPSIEQPLVVSYREGYFVLLMKSKADFELVLNGGPYYMNRQPVLIYKWSPEFGFKNEVMKKFSVWIRLRELPYNCWSEESLSRISSVLGTPLCADDYTSTMKRISYARVRVEVDVTKEIQL